MDDRNGNRREGDRTDDRAGGGLERLGAWLFRATLRLVPRSLRDVWGREMLHAFLLGQARHRRERGLSGLRGLFALLRFWLREAAGLVRMAYRARRPGPWARRTAPAPSASARLRPTWSTLVDHLVTDLRFALRTFLRKPGMMGLAALSLALGLGASTAMFSVVDSVLLRPLPYDEPDELVRVYVTNPEFRGHPTFGEFADRGTPSLPEYWWMQENQRSLEGLGAWYRTAHTLTGTDGPPEEVEAVAATPELLSVLRLSSLRGRLLEPADAGESRLMITERFWRARFGADPEVVGSTLRLDDEPWTVVGVLPERADAITTDADAWRLTVGSSAEGNWGNHGAIAMVGRLAEGVGPAAARAELSRLMADVPEGGHDRHGAFVQPALQEMTRQVRPALLALIAGSVLLLLVGCGNVAAILVGAGIDREQEIAVRGSLGAGPGRLARQLLTESLALAFVGAAGGIALAWLIAEGLLYLAPADVPRIGNAVLDARALGFGVAAAGIAGVLFGMVPALGLSRPDLARTITSSRGTTSGKGRIQAAVVVGELALATVLLVSAGLLGRSLFALNRAELGLEPEGLYALQVAAPWQRFTGDDAFDRAVAYLDEIQAAVDAQPGVAGVAMTSIVPLTGDRSNTVVIPEGWEAEHPEEQLVAERRFVSEGYFATAGIDLVEGRDFAASDNRADAAPTIVISEGLARTAWPGESALGKEVSASGGDPATVIGVARDLRDQDPLQATLHAFYLPAKQGAVRGNFLVRVEGDPDAVLPAVRSAVWSVDADLPITELTAMDEFFRDAVSEQRYRARLMIAFAALASLFAMLGVYGVVSRNVARRTREMGIRMALGARRARVRTMVVRQGVRLALWGALLGLAGSLAAARLLRELLYEVKPYDPVVLVGITAFVAVASVLATLPPSARATSVKPSTALRTE